LSESICFLFHQAPQQNYQAPENLLTHVPWLYQSQQTEHWPTDFWTPNSPVSQSEKPLGQKSLSRTCCWCCPLSR